jgi:hypothetical protein
MAESLRTSGRGRAAWPLLLLFGLLALTAVFGGPLLEARGFADGAALVLTALVATLVIGMLRSGRTTGAPDTGSTAGVLSEMPVRPSAPKAADGEEGVDLEGLDFPLV